MKTPISYDWIKKLSPAIKELDEIPLIGDSSPFPWMELSKQIAHVFEIEDLKLIPKEFEWRAPEQLSTGLASPLYLLDFMIPPFEGNVYWAMSNQDIALLMSWLLAKQSNPIGTLDPDFQEGFYRFLTIEVLHALKNVNWEPDIHPKLLSASSTLPDHPCLCVDIDMAFQNQQLWGRLIISPDFRKSWKEHFIQKKQINIFSKSMAEKVNATVHLEAGKVSLTLEEISRIVVGDFIILDSCSLQPGEDKGRVILTVNGSPLFRAKLKPGSIKILESPLYCEVDAPMSKEFSKQDENANDHQEDEDLDTDFDDTDLDEDLETEDEEMEDEDEETENEEIEEEYSEEEQHELPRKESSIPAQPKTPPDEKPSVEPTQKKSVSVQDMPVNLVIEIARLQMTFQQLSNLQPGNVLEVNVTPESGVDLVVNGKCIGKGELLQIGEALGVRVLDLG